MNNVARMQLANCPQCQEVGSIREIFYGMPRGDVDEDRYFLGGCLVTDDDPKYACITCDWRGDSWA